MKGTDGNSLALTFTVKSPGQGTKEIAGLAMAAVSASGPGLGAVLSDDADRFRTTVRPMLQRLLAGAGGLSGGSSPPGSANASGANSGAGSAPAQASQAPAAASPSGSSPAHASSSTGAPPVAATLHQTPFPDGSGTVGLPDGWEIVGSHAGEVAATGPSPPAGLHFRWHFDVLDPNDPRSRNVRLVSQGMIRVPYGNDSATIFKAITTQFIQQQRKPVPAIEVLSAQKGGDNRYFVVANSNGQDPVRTWTHMQIDPPGAQGIYFVLFWQVGLPQQIAEQNRSTVGAIFSSYTINDQVAAQQIQGDTRAQADWFKHQQADQARRQDAQDRQFAAFDNDLLDRTVIRDIDLHGHGLVSNDLADALVEANPNRFQEASASEYVKGVDY